MEKYNILHLTDWHLNNPAAIEEKLRAGFYRDYINGLYTKTLSSGISSIDLIVCTGDFIDKGIVTNFNHATEVLGYIIEKFSINPGKVFVNIGNHDIDVSGLKIASKKEFEKFESPYSRLYKTVARNSFYDLLDIGENVFILKLDSIFNENNEINNDASNSKIVYPSILEDESIDEVVTSIEKNVKGESLLIITSHFPLIINNRMTMILEDDKWLTKHLWASGMKMIKRIIANRIDKNILCLYGDGHLDNYWSYSEKHHFFMTGMFGGNYLNNHYISKKGQIKAYNKTNDAKIIQYDIPTFQTPIIYNFTYLPEGYDYSSQYGEWKLIQENIRIENTKIISYPSTPNIDQQDSNQAKTKEFIEGISEVIQEKIIEEIRFKNLFSVSRTVTSEKESSLGWISISSLFQNQNLFCLSIEKMKEWITKNGIEENDNSFICGLGFWGAVFAAQLGARTGIKSFSVSSKRIKASHNYFESIQSFKEETTGRSFKNIILITDVISTGNSILLLKEELSSCINVNQTKWYALSVLSDKTQERLQKITEFEKMGSLCITLPIPVIDNDKLPDESIFPITFDFR